MSSVAAPALALPDALPAVRVEPAADDAAWDAYVDGHPQGTVYHRAAWRHALTRSFGYRAFPLLARDAAGRITGLLPLFEVRTPFSRRLVAVPFRDRGGVIADDAASFAALVAAAAETRRARRAAFVTIKTVEPYAADAAREAGLAERRYWVRSLLTLSGLDEAALLKQVGGKTRNMIRQAERAGCTFHDLAAEGTPAAAAAAFATIHVLAQRNLGLPPFPLAFFRRVLEGLGPSRARVYAVRRGGAVVAATLVFQQRDTAIYGYSASDPTAREARPNDFMLFGVLRDALLRGLRAFDMGSDAPSQESLLFFKQKWGAVSAPVPSYTLGAAPEWVADSQSPRWRMARAVVRRLPVPALKLLGATAVRFFG